MILYNIVEIFNFYDITQTDFSQFRPSSYATAYSLVKFPTSRKVGKQMAEVPLGHKLSEDRGCLSEFPALKLMPCT